MIYRDRLCSKTDVLCFLKISLESKKKVMEFSPFGGDYGGGNKKLV